ncbi:MAG TPA: glycosyltransferase, partial [Candidatus Polarisedimenticolia bacterium]|nr:glycosyltransferase [Candidatus Polarisedimenticolia bacterium]
PSRPLAAHGELDVAAAHRLAQVVREEQVTLLHYHTAHAVTLGTLAMCFCGRRPAVATRRVSFPLHGRLLGRLKYRFHVDRVLAVSEEIRRRLVSQGLDAERVVVIHSGIDPECYERGDRGRFRASLGLSPLDPSGNGPLIGSVGHLAPHKGMDRFVEAAGAARELPGARFVVVGEGEEETRLRRLVERRGLRDRILFAGFREDMPDVFAGLDLFVLASSSGEGSPAVIKEAMAAGVPMVVTALEGVSEIVEDRRHALVVPPGNVAALARAIVLLASDADLRRRLSAAARARVREFSSDRMIERTEAVYRSLLGNA